VTNLRETLDDYLKIRRALGFLLHDHEAVLRDFVDDLDRAGLDHITTEHALAWATKPVGVQPYRWKARLSMVGGFAAYVKALDPLTEVPATDLLGYRYSRPTPYLYSQVEIDRLLAAAGELRPRRRAMTHQTLFSLLAVAGLRVGEAIRLDRVDVEFGTGLLTVRDTKFKKSRRLPLHPSTVHALARYAEQRDHHFPRPQTESFFVSVRGARLLDTHVHATFREVVRLAAIQPRSTACRPVMHGLRHSFAVNTLLRWYQSDADTDVGTNLPLLSAYMGHVSPASTYWYLEAAPELLALVSQRLERVVEALP